jgi:hypothetical protein
MKMGKSIVEIGDMVVPSKLGRRVDFKVGEIFEIELPDTIWIIADCNEDKLICVSAGQIDVIE